jgi:glutamate-ammonia-ligase adenylyltransferase
VVKEKIRLLTEEFSKRKKWKKDYMIIVLGSTGTGTMTFASDVDLIFAVKNSGKYQNVQKDFQELLGSLKKELSPFSVDCRLRPEGASSQLVWDFKKYVEYINKRARIWEFRSLLKARFICGDKKLFNSLVDSFFDRISILTKEELIRGISEVRSKSLSIFPAEMDLVDLKKNPGGLSDVEYIAHYLLFTEEKQPKNLIGESIPEIFKNFKSNKKVLNKLADNYIFIKNLEIFNQIAFSTSSSKLSVDENKYNKLAHFLETDKGAEIKKKLNSALQFNRESYSKIILNK